MALSVAGSAIYGELFSDPEVALRFSDESEVRAMVDFEAALALAQGRLGVIPAEAAERIDRALADVVIEPAALAAGTASAGVAIPPLVAALRQAVGGEAAQYVHWGATSQDVIDTGLVLRLREVLGHLDARLESTIHALAAQADRHRTTVLAARTRSQQATPTTFGLKIAGWLLPLHRHRQRLRELLPRLLVVQLGGASGNLAALGDRGVAVMEALAEALGLGVPALPWHTQRDGIFEVASWFGLVTGSLGKMGQDLVLLAQSEVGEASAGAGGGSSTMPQKANPVAAEMLVALARMSTGLVANLHGAMIQEHERGGPGWTVEWTALPELAVAAGAALAHGERMAGSLAARPERMAANLDESAGLLLAEAASFALSRHLPRPEAQALVKSACQEAIAEGRHLMDVLAEKTDAPVDWQTVRDPAGYVGVAAELVDRALAEVGEG